VNCGIGGEGSSSSGVWINGLVPEWGGRFRKWIPAQWMILEQVLAERLALEWALTQWMVLNLVLEEVLAL